MNQAEILQLLPEVFRRASALKTGARPAVLDAVLGVMAGMHAPVEYVLDHLDGYFDPRQASDDFLPFLAGWVDMDPLLNCAGPRPEGLYWLRNLIRSAAVLSRERGTPKGLVHFLQLATGLPGFRVTSAQAQPFHISIEYPPEAEPYRAWMEQVIHWEKPAYVTFDLCRSAGTADEPAGAVNPSSDETTLNQRLAGATHERATEI